MVSRSFISSLFLLLISVFSLPACTASHYYVGLVVHPTDPHLSKALVDSFGFVDCVQLPAQVFTNDSAGVDSAIVQLKEWLDIFQGYDVVIQTYYEFGVITDRDPYLKQFNLSSCSQEFYDEWFHDLALLCVNYSVVLVIGFNEPCLHFEPCDVEALLAREYAT